jgi:hypothetical protein
MGLEVITKEDLQQFRLQLLNEIREMLKPSKPSWSFLAQNRSEKAS